MTKNDLKTAILDEVCLNEGISSWDLAGKLVIAQHFVDDYLEELEHRSLVVQREDEVSGQTLWYSNED